MYARLLKLVKTIHFTNIKINYIIGTYKVKFTHRVERFCRNTLRHLKSLLIEQSYTTLFLLELFITVLIKSFHLKQPS